MTWTCCGTARCRNYSAGSGRRPFWVAAVVYLGNVLHLEQASRLLLADLARAPLLPVKDTVAFPGVDSMQKRVYRHKKYGAAFGLTKIQGKACSFGV
jgi:hypothetical protein